MEYGDMNNQPEDVQENAVVADLKVLSEKWIGRTQGICCEGQYSNRILSKSYNKTAAEDKSINGGKHTIRVSGENPCWGMTALLCCGEKVYCRVG
jgi:hypothetical protein